MSMQHVLALRHRVLMAEIEDSPPPFKKAASDSSLLGRRSDAKTVKFDRSAPFRPGSTLETMASSVTGNTIRTGGWPRPLHRPSHLPKPVFTTARSVLFNDTGVFNSCALVGGKKLDVQMLPLMHYKTVTLLVPHMSGAWFVDCPRDIYPTERFRVFLEGVEMIVVCPNITATGQRIIVQLQQL
eukprot:CAMPEP_0173168694 /NCGR_PEP_ID=MMETSP1141-20130122/293_1 /TAXON_ID=483371 /ORGANISM="non described non described, Strain CCMP2298" /LENGTH=183 /DNA_ID=CAMNT_0014090443 /DNA_START=7 /DNA_END=558 /DNA_ORIENTATION=-